MKLQGLRITRSLYSSPLKRLVAQIIELRSQGLIYMLAQMDPRFVSGIFWFVIHALYETSTQWQKVLKRYLVYR